MNVSIVTPVVVSPDVVITMTHDEALVVAALAGMVAGSGEERKVTDALYAGILRATGAVAHRDVSGRFTGTIYPK